MPSISSVKRAQKESLLYKEISKLFSQAALDDPKLLDLFVNRVSLSRDKGVCTVYFYTEKGEDYFNQILQDLILYKPSLRKAIGDTIRSRYVPEIVFKFDKGFEKQLKVDALLEKIKNEDK